MNDKGINIETLKNKILENGHQLSRNSIGNILNERNSPKMETIQIIANALDVDLHELFINENSSKNETKNELDGFIELNGQIHRIKSFDEFRQLYAKLVDNESSVRKKEETIRVDEPQSFIQGSLLVRAKTRMNVNKLQRHVFQRYNVTVSNKREMESQNNLPRDARIWIFNSEKEEKKARSIVQNALRYRFNT